MPDTEDERWGVIYFAAVARGMTEVEAMAEADRIIREDKQKEEACTPLK